MRFLLDTHVWLWLLASPERVNDAARAALAEPEGTRRLSAAALWEAAIKAGMGKLRLEQPLSRYLAVSLADLAVEPLPVTAAHALAVADLPPHHRDPFDRILVAQATVEGLTLVTADPALYAYEVGLLWAGPGRAPRRPARRGRAGAAARAGHSRAR